MPSRLISEHPQLAVPTDLDLLCAFENRAFPEERRESRESLRRSLKSPHQEVWILRGVEGELVASMTLRMFKHSLRIYSIAVDPGSQGIGLGETFMHLAEKRAAILGKRELRLEADGGNPRLLAWYNKQGYKVHEVLKGYYGPDTSAHRLIKAV